MEENQEECGFGIGDTVRVIYCRKWKSWHTPHWADCYTGKVLRLNPTTVTIEVKDSHDGARAVRVDYDDLVLVSKGQSTKLG